MDHATWTGTKFTTEFDDTTANRSVSMERNTTLRISNHDRPKIFKDDSASTAGVMDVHVVRIALAECYPDRR